MNKQVSSTIAVSALFSLRLMGIFMFIPVASFYTSEIVGQDSFLTGLAVGICGLSTAALQLPLGMLSDKIGRGPVITFGLIVFTLGSFVAYYFNTITGLIVGRMLQGAGAIGATSLAALGDLTTKDFRNKAMAIVGISIGFSFFLAFSFGTLLLKTYSKEVIFQLAALLGVLALVVHNVFLKKDLLEIFKNKKPYTYKISTGFKLLTNYNVLFLNLSVMLLHTLFTSFFTFLPSKLVLSLGIEKSQLWHIFIPMLVLSAVFMLIIVGYIDKKRRGNQLINYGKISAVVALSLFAAVFILEYTKEDYYLVFISLVFFFTAFNIIEALLPSLVTKIVPLEYRGISTGFYSSFQYLGLFLGGTLGGYLTKMYGPGVIVYLSAVIVCIWLVLIKYSNLKL